MRTRILAMSASILFLFAGVGRAEGPCYHLAPSGSCQEWFGNRGTSDPCGPCDQEHNCTKRTYIYYADGADWTTQKSSAVSGLYDHTDKVYNLFLCSASGNCAATCEPIVPESEYYICKITSAVPNQIQDDYLSGSAGCGYGE